MSSFVERTSLGVLIPLYSFQHIANVLNVDTYNVVASIQVEYGRRM